MAPALDHFAASSPYAIYHTVSTSKDPTVDGLVPIAAGKCRMIRIETNDIGDRAFKKSGRARSQGASSACQRCLVECSPRRPMLGRCHQVTGLPRQSLRILQLS